MCFANRDKLFAQMSRVKSRIQTEICGDCGASDPSWASINRGILLCADCCSVHRSLGRHISQVKSLRQGSWSPSVLALVNGLNAHGANSVWEHCMLDSVVPKNLRRKPSPKDPLHPNKADFIRTKHVNLSFVLKTNVQNDEGTHQETELSKQLHASVRSVNLETSLRLLVQGANPNFYYEEKGSTPLHAAAKAGQASQVELLLVYGAEINALDGNGKNAIEIARINKHQQIADRLLESLYEVTDRLCYFLNGRKPDHNTKEHLLIPEQTAININEQLKIARGKLFVIPNKMFEELVMDLYDEVDRRETEAVWTTSSLNPEIGAVPFLPTNPHLSATRNQGRQKLARFSQAQFAGLLTDVLIDGRRRQNMAKLKPIEISQLRAIHGRGDQSSELNLSDDEPLYDAVASDDDYAALAPVAQQTFINKSPINNVSTGEFETLKKQLEESESTINDLKTLVQKLSCENSELKSKIDPNDATDLQLRIESIMPIESNDIDVDGKTESTLHSKQQQYMKRPVSMYETRESPFNKYQQQAPDNRATSSMYHMASGKGNGTSLPLANEVKHRTDQVTRCIQELWTSVQDISVKDAFVPCAERIRFAVVELTAIFPTVIQDEKTKGALQQMGVNTDKMQTHCAGLQQALLNENTQKIDSFLQEVRNCAYDLAMATKMLVTQFQ